MAGHINIVCLRIAPICKTLCSVHCLSGHWFVIRHEVTTETFKWEDGSKMLFSLSWL